MSTHPHGRITQAEADRMLSSYPKGSRRREEVASVLALLTDKPGRPVRASTAGYDDGDEEFEAEFASLYPPKTAEEAERRRELAEHIRASSPQLSEDELVAALWPEGER
jgi:hypothetical protein